MKQISIEDLVAKDMLITEIPPWIKLQNGQYWCPYCHRAIKFVKDRYLGVRKCQCGISDRDFNVKKINNLWL